MKTKEIILRTGLVVVQNFKKEVTVITIGGIKGSHLDGQIYKQLND